MKLKLVLTSLAIMGAGAFYYFNNKQLSVESAPNSTSTISESFNHPISEGDAPSTNHSNDIKKSPSSLIKQLSTDSASLPHWKEAFNDYVVPEQNISAEVDEILESIQEDSSGEPELKLSRILDYCSQAAKNEEQLEYLKSLNEEASLMAGQTNGETINNIDRAVNQYKECKGLDGKGLFEGYDYVEASATKGNPKAKTKLATLYEPKDFAGWSNDAKDEYRSKMEKNLSEARNSCEPQAFYSYAYGVGEGELWTDSSEVPEDVRKYSNLLARGMIYAKQTKGAEEFLKSELGKLRSLASNMTEYDINEAEKYGRYLYEEACE